jgi:hypothetical protein
MIRTYAQQITMHDKHSPRRPGVAMDKHLPSISSGATLVDGVHVPTITAEEDYDSEAGA